VAVFEVKFALVQPEMLHQNSRQHHFREQITAQLYQQGNKDRLKTAAAAVDTKHEQRHGDDPWRMVSGKRSSRRWRDIMARGVSTLY